jgi:hypothetical protein
LLPFAIVLISEKGIKIFAKKHFSKYFGGKYENNTTHYGISKINVCDSGKYIFFLFFIKRGIAFLHNFFIFVKKRNYYDNNRFL